MAERDSDTGRYTETYPLSEFVEALTALGGEAGTQAVADQVGCKYRTANSKLHKLEENGKVKAQNVGNAYLWKIDPEENTNRK